VANKSKKRVARPARQVYELVAEFCKGGPVEVSVIQAKCLRDPKRAGIGAQAHSLCLTLCALGILQQVRAGRRGKCGVFEPGPRMRGATGLLRKAESELPRHGLKLRVPYGTHGSKRDIYLAQLAAWAEGSDPRAVVRQAERVALAELTTAVSQAAPANGSGDVTAFLVNGGLPMGHVLMRRDGVWALGRPNDMRLVAAGGER
jgi:hypothetical protein